MCCDAVVEDIAIGTWEGSPLSFSLKETESVSLEVYWATAMQAQNTKVSV